MTELRYVFADALTGKIIDEFPMFSVSVSLSVDTGEFTGFFGLDQSGYDNDQLISASVPGRSFVIVESENRVIWGGLVWSRTYQSQAKSVQVYAKSLDQYPTKRLIHTDWDFTDTDPRNIFRTLYMDMQADPYSISVSIPAAFDNASIIDFDVAASELKTYRSVFDTLSTAADSGFEWTIDWQRVGNAYTRTLRVGKPLGSPLSDNSVVFEYPGNILNYWRNDTIASGGTDMYGVGAGEGDSMLVSQVEYSDLLANGYPRLEDQVSFKDVDDMTVLDGLTKTQADIYKAPQPVYSVQMKADREPAFGDYGLGDFCKLVLKDPLHPAPGVTFATRVLKWDYTPPSSSDVEQVQLSFQGDDNG